MNNLLKYLFPQYFIIHRGRDLLSYFKEDQYILETVRRSYGWVIVSIVLIALCLVSLKFTIPYLLLHGFLITHPFISNMIHMENALKGKKGSLS